MEKPVVEKVTPINNLIRFHTVNMETAMWLRIPSVEVLEKDTIKRLEELKKLKANP